MCGTDLAVLLAVDWPHAQIESIPPDRFVPEFCPRPACEQHRLDGALFRCLRLKATYRRKCDGRIVPRFRCRACRRGFSQQSFAVSYYLKRPQLTVPIAKTIVNGAAHRQAARIVGCVHSTVTKRLARLGRHAQLLHRTCLAEMPPIWEPINYDDFEAFTGSQYHPCGIGTAVGHHSWFIYGLGFAPHRRGGELSAAQRLRRAYWDQRAGPRLRDPYARSLGRQLEILVPRARVRPVVLVSDDKKDYARAIRRHPLGHEVLHVVHRNPKRGPKGSPRTPEARARDQAMFPIDALHRFVRHSVKSHARETIAFGRRTEAQLERTHLFAAFRNLIKRRSERHPRSITPAMWLGLTASPWSWERMFARRLQPTKTPDIGAWPELYERLMQTPTLVSAPPHRLKLAF